MSRPNIEAMRRQLAQAEEHDDALVDKCRSILKAFESERRNREERDAAIKASLDQDRAEFCSKLTTWSGEVHQIIASIQGAPVQIDANAPAQLQAAE
jgi:hypothetical protein